MIEQNLAYCRVGSSAQMMSQTYQQTHFVPYLLALIEAQYLTHKNILQNFLEMNWEALTVPPSFGNNYFYLPLVLYQVH